MIDQNIVNVGNKPPANYVFSALMAFENGYNEVILRARGNNITNALKVAGMIVDGMIPDTAIKEVKLSFDEKPDEERPEKKVYIPSMEIVIENNAEPKEYVLPEVENEDALILIGRKDIQVYAVFAASKLKEHSKVHLRARGNKVAKAAKVAAVLTNMISKKSKVSDVKIGFSKIEEKRGKKKKKETIPEIDIEISL